MVSQNGNSIKIKGSGFGTQVTRFLNRINISKSFCSFNVGLNNAIYDASKLSLLNGDKDSSVVIMNRTNYNNIMQKMIDDGIKNKIYEETTDSTLKDLKNFQDFLYRNFKDYENYDEMRPVSNQPARLYGTAKTHKFENLKDITPQNLKCRPIIDQIGTFTYKAAKVISNYLKPLRQNEYSISDTQQFPDMLSNLPPLSEDEEDVSYDVEFLFTNIPIKETIDYIIEQIYTHKKLKPLCRKLIFKRLLLKLATECTYTFNHKFYKQINGCTMRGPLSVTLSDIFIIKMERVRNVPHKPLFYRRFVDDIYNRRKKSQRDELFKKLNNYHPKIKLTIEVSPKKFLDTSLDLNNGIYNFKVHRKTTKQPTHWSSKIPKRYKRNVILGDLHRSFRISSDLNEEIKLISHKYDRADYPKRFVNSVIRQFQEKPNQHNIDDFDEYIIPPNFFDTPKPFILIELPFCETNETKSKHFLKKFHRFTKDHFDVAIKWKTKQVKSLFPLKDKKMGRTQQSYKKFRTCQTFKM